MPLAVMLHHHGARDLMWSELRRLCTLSLLGAELVCTLAASPSTADASVANYSHTSWTAKDGLPVGPVMAMTLDSEGFLWIGGQTGLVRFDGLRFVRWEELGQPALPPIPITALAAGDDGVVWIGFGNEGGVSRIDRNTSTHYTVQDGVPAGSIRVIRREGNAMWIGGSGGLSRFQDGEWHPMGSATGLPPSSVESLYVDAAGTLWVGTSTGIYRRDTREQLFRRAALLPYTVRAFAEDPQGVIVVSHPSEALRAIDERPMPVAVPHLWGATNGSALLRDRRGNLWVGTIGQGLIFIPSTGEPVERITDSSGLTGSWVFSLLEDLQGNIWVGTLGGVDLIRESRVKTIGRPELQGELVRALTADKQEAVWIGTSSGLHHLSGGTWTTHRLEQGLPKSGVTALYTDDSGTVWIGADSQLAYVAGNQIRTVPLPRSTSIERISAITRDPLGHLWLCDYIRGLFRWDGVQLTAFTDIPGIGSNGCTAAYTDRRGRTWIGFVDGTLVLRDYEGFKTYSANEGLAGGVIRAIHGDDSDTLWIGSHNGLTRYSDGRFISLTAREGLPGNGVSGIVEDRFGRLWVGLLTGILRLDPREFDKFVKDASYRIRYRLYDNSDGLTGVLLSTGYPSAAASADGSLIFLTTAGPVAIDSTGLAQPQRAPSVRIEGGTADGRRLPMTPDMTLPASTSSLAIDYLALNLVAPTGIQVRYMLEGLDSAWVEAGSRRQAVYENLPPRQYRFRVTASNSDGEWNEREATWAFTIAPPFYYSTWFLLMCLSTASVAVWGGWRLRVSALRKRFADVTSERTRIAREIHDTLLQSLIGVTIQLDAVCGTLDASADTAKPLLERIRRRLEFTIRETRDSILDLRSSSLERRSLSTALEESAERVLASTPTAFEVTTVGRERRCDAWLEEQILRVAQEALSNVLRHAEATHLSMTLRYDSALSLSIEDNGRGFDPLDASRELGVHCGLATMRERVAKAGGRLDITTAPGKGTSLHVSVPLTGSD